MESIATLSLEELAPHQINALVAVGIAAGTLYCFLGYRTIKFVIGLTGFLLAGAVAAVLAGIFTEGHLLTMGVAGVLGGVCGAMALAFLYRTGIFVIGLLAAALIAHEALAQRPEAWIPLLTLGVGIAGGVVALLIERPVVMLATSAIGAWMLVAGVVFFLFNPEGLMDARGANAIDEHQFTITAAWLVLGLLGAFTQWVTRAKPAKT
jgi:hypothetical protein